MKKIMMIAGEPSGDLHGSSLASEIKKLSPKIELIGTGGKRMKQAGVRLFYELKDLGMVGLLDVIKAYFRLKSIQSTLLSKIKEEKPDLIIFIDFSGFNLRFATKAHKYGVPMVYYISPQVWAWRKGRIKVIKKYIKKMYCIFKFEEDLYRKAGVPVEFIGHPLLDVVTPHITHDELLKKLRLRSDNKIVALLPGSRKSLVKALLPTMLKAADIIHKKLPDVQFLISKSPAVDMKIYEHMVHDSHLPISLIESRTYEIINTADLVLTISGTATLETAILEKPLLILYKLRLLEYLLAKPLLRLKDIGLVNIVAGEMIAPEFIQFGTSPKKIAKEAVELLSDTARYEAMKKRLADVKAALYPDGASHRAAASILEK